MMDIDKSTEIVNAVNEELVRLLEQLRKLDPKSDEYGKVLEQINNIQQVENDKVKNTIDEINSKPIWKVVAPIAGVVTNVVLGGALMRYEFKAGGIITSKFANWFPIKIGK